MAFALWTGGRTGDWSTNGNWSTDTIPASGDVAIDQTGQITATNTGIDDVTIWLDYDQSNAPSTPFAQHTEVGLSLMGSSLGASSSLLLNSDRGTDTVELHNSALHGDIFAASGASYETLDAGTSAVNYGWIGVASSTAYTTDTLVAYGSFANNGLVEVGQNGQFGLVFGTDTNSYQYVFNSGIIQADLGGSIALNAEDQATTPHGAVVNTNQIKTNGGSIYVNADLVQAPGASVAISGDGSVGLSGKADGGTIQIDSGALYLDTGKSLSFLTPSNFNATLEFTGQLGTLGFSAAVQETYDTTSNSLFISQAGTNQMVADLQLGTNRTYSAADFTAYGADVYFIAHPIG